MTIKDKGMSYRLARTSVLLALSGIGKSPLLRSHMDDVKSARVVEAMRQSTSEEIRSMVNFEHLREKGAAPQFQNICLLRGWKMLVWIWARGSGVHIGVMPSCKCNYEASRESVKC
jgi:hypothetical protein